MPFNYSLGVDLSHTFEFNLQAAAGVRWFLKDNVALTIEARYLPLVLRQHGIRQTLG